MLQLCGLGGWPSLRRVRWYSLRRKLPQAAVPWFLLLCFGTFFKRAFWNLRLQAPRTGGCGLPSSSSSSSSLASRGCPDRSGSFGPSSEAPSLVALQGGCLDWSGFFGCLCESYLLGRASCPEPNTEHKFFLSFWRQLGRPGEARSDGRG